MKDISLKIKGFFSKGHERSIKAKKNIAISFLLKGISILIGFVLIPLTISYVNPTQYGIWLTLSSVIAWFGFFDVGLGSGLKNKLAEANALGDYKNAKIFVSTTYAILAIISSCILIIFAFINRFVNWSVILNTTAVTGDNLSFLAFLVIAIFCVQFVVQLINIVLTANHEPSKASLISVVGQIVSFLIILVLTKTTTGSLIKLVIVLGGTPVLIQLLISIWLYFNNYSKYSPSFNFIQLKYAKSLLQVGGIFFFIQIGALLLFQTDNIVITQLFGPKEVTVFNIAYKLFSSITMVFTIVMTPFWSAFTDAYAKGDMDWIKAIQKKMQGYWLYVTLFAVMLLILSPYIYKLWLRGAVTVPFSLSLAVMLYVVCYNWIMIQCYLLNGINKVRLQLYLYIVSTIVNIPLAIFLAKYTGIMGVSLSNVIVLLFMGIILYKQKNMILSGTAKGIWNK